MSSLKVLVKILFSMNINTEGYRNQKENEQ